MWLGADLLEQAANLRSNGSDNAFANYHYTGLPLGTKYASSKFFVKAAIACGRSGANSPVSP
jgi:hypothetical protein